MSRKARRSGVSAARAGENAKASKAIAASAPGRKWNCIGLAPAHSPDGAQRSPGFMSRGEKPAFRFAPCGLRLVAQECGDPGIALELCQILRRGQLRLVARGIDHAEKAERLALRGAELVPSHRRHGDEIAGFDRPHLFAHET